MSTKNQQAQKLTAEFTKNVPENWYKVILWNDTSIEPNIPRGFYAVHDITPQKELVFAVGNSTYLGHYMQTARAWIKGMKRNFGPLTRR